LKRKQPVSEPPLEVPQVAQPKVFESERPAEFFPDADIWKGSTVYPNTAQIVIITTEDKVRNYLHDYSRAINIRTKWIAPLTLFFAIGGSLLTVSFTEKFGNSAEFWRAIFWVGCVVSAFWFVYEAIRVPLYWKKGDTESLINKLKNLE
jgi:MFS family permease